MMTLLSDAWSMQVSVLKRDQEEPGTSRTARTRNVRHNREEDGDLDGEGRGREVQGRDIDKDTYKAEGAGRQSMYKAEGAGRRGINKDEGAGHRGMYKGGGAGRQDTRVPTDLYQAGNKEANFNQYKENRNISTIAKLRKAGEEVITERHPQHKVKAKGKEEATGVVNEYKRPVLKDKEGKRKKEVRELKQCLRWAPFIWKDSGFGLFQEMTQKTGR